MAFWKKLIDLSPVHRVAGTCAVSFVQGSAMAPRLDAACMTHAQAAERIERVQAMLLAPAPDAENAQRIPGRYHAVPMTPAE